MDDGRSKPQVVDLKLRPHETYLQSRPHDTIALSTEKRQTPGLMAGRGSVQVRIRVPKEMQPIQKINAVILAPEIVHIERRGIVWEVYGALTSLVYYDTVETLAIEAVEMGAKIEAPETETLAMVFADDYFLDLAEVCPEKPAEEFGEPAAVNLSDLKILEGEDCEISPGIRCLKHQVPFHFTLDRISFGEDLGTREGPGAGAETGLREGPVIDRYPLVEQMECVILGPKILDLQVQMGLQTSALPEVEEIQGGFMENITGIQKSNGHIVSGQGSAENETYQDEPNQHVDSAQYQHADQYTARQPAGLFSGPYAPGQSGGQPIAKPDWGTAGDLGNADLESRVWGEVNFPEIIDLPAAVEPAVDFDLIAVDETEVEIETGAVTEVAIDYAKTVAGADPETEMEADPMAETEVEIEAEADAEAETLIDYEPEYEAGAEAEIEAEIDYGEAEAEPDAVAEMEAEIEAGVGAEAKAMTDYAVEVECEAKVEMEAEAQAMTDYAEAEIEAVTWAKFETEKGFGGIEGEANPVSEAGFDYGAEDEDETEIKTSLTELTAKTRFESGFELIGNEPMVDEKAGDLPATGHSFIAEAPSSVVETAGAGQSEIDPLNTALVGIDYKARTGSINRRRPDWAERDARFTSKNGESSESDLNVMNRGLSGGGIPRPRSLNRREFVETGQVSTGYHPADNAPTGLPKTANRYFSRRQSNVYRYYQIQLGDDWEKIAIIYRLPIAAVREANPAAPEVLTIGDKLKIPSFGRQDN